MFEFEENLNMNAKIKVVGVGGGGGNSIMTMMKEQIDGVDFVAINTDVQSLKTNDAMIKIQIGSKLTKGLGSGSNPDVGKSAALEDEAIIRDSLEGSDMVFITAGMGGGTGTGAAPVIGKVAKELGILTVGVVTKPFAFEGRKRLKQAEAGIKALQESVDTLICIPNDNLLNIADKQTPITDSFKMVDQIVLQAVRGISDLITTPGLINLDFADIQTIMKGSGLALMGSAVASGENRALQAAKLAISSPLLENVSIAGATGIILNITGTSHMTLFEVNEASKLIQQECDEDVNIIFGTVIDESMTEELRVTVIATGFGQRIESMKQNARSTSTKTASRPASRYRDIFEAPAREPVAPQPEVQVQAPAQRPAVRQQPQPQPRQTEEPMVRKIIESTPPQATQQEQMDAPARQNIRDVFDQMNQEPSQVQTQEIDIPLEQDHDFSHPENFLAASEPVQQNQEKNLGLQHVQKEPEARQLPFDQGALNSFQRPKTAWGEPKQQEPIERRSPARHSTDQTQEEEMNELFKEFGLNDEDDEYKVPAFIRRRAD